ncbi:MAG: RnfABCDGE type electron transport complex subunit D [Acutalibacteraceae bacterium]|jgi:electron transport complex protein RnfD
MALKLSAAPYGRLTTSAGSRGWMTALLLLPLALFSGVYYGLRPILLLAVGVAAANVCELLACGLLKRCPTLFDGSATVTGLLIGLLMSPLSPYWLPALAAAFAIWVVKMPFGGNGHEPFVPAAAGIAVVTQCFPAQLFTYPAPNLIQPLPLWDVSAAVSETSPAALLASGTAPAYSLPAWLLGQIPGPIGATAAVLLIACGIGLFARRLASPLITLPYLLTCAVWALAFPRVAGDPLSGLIGEMCSGYLLFSGFFLLPAAPIAPRHPLARAVYGVGGGALTMLLRANGRFEASACFAVLLMNALAPLIDRGCWRLAHRFVRKGGAL